MTYDETATGPIMREEADPRLAALFAQPESGYAPDPKEKDVLWVYTSEEERREVARKLRQRVRAADDGAIRQAQSQFPQCPPGVLPPILPRVQFRRDANLLGQEVFTTGGASWDNFGAFGFNDAMTSLEFFDGQVVLFEHAGWQGHNLLLLPDITFTRQVVFEDGSHCVDSHDFRRVDNLGAFIMIKRTFWFDTSWNDQASSAHFIADGR